LELPFSSERKFSDLSLVDLLRARDQFHVHLMNKANVVGTAIGRYLIRKSDPYPSDLRSDEEAPPSEPKGKRTLENSELRSYSWPCVLVFVSRWVDEDRFAKGSEDVSASDFVPDTIYLPDGRRVPICIVEAPLIERTVGSPPLENLRFPSVRIGGGYPVIARAQQVEHVASIGCLVTDGHLTYALTSRHVAGEPGEELFSIVCGERVSIGRSSSKQLRRAGFEDIYQEWPGKNVFVNLDIGLIEVADLRQWTTQIYGVGQLGQLADLSTINLSLDVIGCPLRAYGCASHALYGEVSALFYRFKAVGGFEYVADFLIGSRTEEPLATRPGDSGTVWVVETDNPSFGLMPIAVQWGGSVFAAGRAKQFPFALATNLSTVCRELDVDLVRDRNFTSFNYWGPVGHYTIGRIACDLVEDSKLRRLMRANRLRVSFEQGHINEKDIDENTKKVEESGFVPLADVPDIVWKRPRTDKFPAGRRGDENPTHYADLDQPDSNAGSETLLERLNEPADLTVQAFQEYYDDLGHKQSRQRGLLPFRVWQCYDEMVKAVSDREISRFICAAGILAHYVGDACQVLHGSYLNDGDPARPGRKHTVHHRNGKIEKVVDPYGKGVHSAYEDTMINDHIDTLFGEVAQAVDEKHGMTLVRGGQEAGFAIVELMKRTRERIGPMDLVEAYVTATRGNENVSEELWNEFGVATQEAIADGCRVLAMLWDSAWHEGDIKDIDNSRLRAIPENRLVGLYSDQQFLSSRSLDEVGGILRA
jgi:hypothetical protein